MNLEDLQKSYQRAWTSLDKKKALTVFLSLCVCGVLVVFARVVASCANAWASLSLAFAPIFMIGGLLFSLGVFLICSYQSPEKPYKEIIKDSWKTLVSVCYITLPMLCLSLLAWLILGFFFLIKQIPAIGEWIGVLLSFAPFMLILASLTLVFATIVLLFFLTPQLAQSKVLSLSIWKEMASKVVKNPLVSLISFMMASSPLLLILALLIGAAVITQMSYLTAKDPILVGLKWFFLMVPFNLLLTPFIIFFFNFAFETSLLLRESYEAQKMNLPS